MKRLNRISASRYDNVPGYKAPEDGYLYIFKHGIGPGTMPSDVHIVKVKDLPNYYTAVWLDSFLTTDELKQYDIPFETDIKYYLDRIGYCLKDGDVVPCDDVEACGKVTSSRRVSANKKYVKAFVTQDREDAWALIDQYMEREWGHVEYNESARAILVMEMPFDGISEDGNSYSEGTCSAIINLIDFELRFNVYIPEAEGIAEEDWDHTIKYDSLADMVTKLIQPMADGEITEEKLYEMCESYYY